MINGCAFHRIITDSIGKPIDYEFIDANSSFERMVGLKNSEIRGKRVTAVLPGIEKDETDWIGIYGDVALTGKVKHFESYSAVLKKWFYISAYSPEKGFFVTIFEDITERKKVEKELLDSKHELLLKVEELEKFNKLVVDRELKMVELKNKNEELQSKIKE